jgi:hypothetical protein
MTQVISDRRDVDFVLHEQLSAETISRNETFAEFNRKTIDLIVTEARNLAIKEILPTQVEGDRQGCRFDQGKVLVPDCYHRAYDLLCKGEWVSMTESLQWGGQEMPKVLAVAASEYFIGANCSFMMYPGLTHGAGKLVETFGTDLQKTLFLKNLYTGKWGGSMLLTEPQAGSDVGALTTSARKNDDGTYDIVGNKIFISGGDQDLTENIIHPVLARIEGAPSGTRGISLFLVPKIRVNGDGSLGQTNDVVCTGIENKLGIHGNSTCSISLGSKGNCKGSLLGTENQGMRHMFLMMNEARQLVGLQAFSMASAAYMYALNYARQRIQGKHILKSKVPDSPKVPIIEHPDVRRQLMVMKSHVEGMRSLMYYAGYLTDRIRVVDDSKEKSR